VAPEDDAKIEAIMHDIFAAMAVEEFPTGEVVTYTAYRNPAAPGQWYMFEHFTAKGAAAHADPVTSPLILVAGHKQLALMTEPYERYELEPVIVHGCGAPIPGAPPPQASRDSATDVGAIYRFKVAPENDTRTERIFRDLFDAMAAEEYGTGNVITYTIYRDPGEPGRWVMFEHFTAQGAADHAAETSPRVRELGHEHLSLLLEPYERVVLKPFIVYGCGEPIPGSPAAGQ
jgi:quinol monooxygenase YgiN